MRIIPVTLRQANAFVREHHRHNDPVGGCKYAIGCMENDMMIGVAIAGRPIARHLDDGLTIEIVRLCTNGHPNACSKLYGAALRIAREMGYRKAITYTRIDEPGVSLRASGWTMEDMVKGRTWNRPGRRRENRSICDKHRWAVYLK
jgi:hypothetical protein